MAVSSPSLTMPKAKLSKALSSPFWIEGAKSIPPHPFFKKILSGSKESLILSLFQKMPEKTKRELLAFSWGGYQIHLVHLAASLNYNQLLDAIIKEPSSKSGELAAQQENYWLNLGDFYGSRAIHHCALVANRIGIEILLSHGDKDAPNKCGATAKRLLQILSQPPIASLSLVSTVEKTKKLEEETSSTATFIPATGGAHDSCATSDGVLIDTSEDWIELKTDEGFKRLSASSFAALKGARSFLVTNHRSELENLLRYYYCRPPVTSFQVNAIQREQLLSTGSLRDTYLNYDECIGHYLCAKRDFAPAEPVVQWFAELVPDFSLHSKIFDIPDSVKCIELEYSIGTDTYNERDYSLACMIQDGFPNVVFLQCQGISGARADRIAYACQSIGRDEPLKIDYARNHKVKLGPHMEHDLEKILHFLEDQAEKENLVEEKERLKTALEKVYVKRYPFDGDYLANIENIADSARWAYIYNTPTTMLLIVMSSRIHREGFLQSMLTLQRKFYRDDPDYVTPRQEIYETFKKTLFLLAKKLDEAEYLGIRAPRYYLEGASLQTRTHSIPEITLWMKTVLQELLTALHAKQIEDRDAAALTAYLASVE